MNLIASEQSILSTICHYLSLNRIPYIHVRNTGSIINRNGQKHFVRPQFSQKGVADIIACYKGIPLAIEVKSRKGVLSTEQQEWLSKWQVDGGGKMLVARSLDDVIHRIESIEKHFETYK